MPKRSNFARRDKDKYLTWDRRAGRAIRPYLPKGSSFVEPCAGRNDLTNQLEDMGHSCLAAYDIAPDAPGIVERDALTLSKDDLSGADLIISNPPWTADILHCMIRHFAGLAPTWLLFHADWAFTLQSQDLMRFCSMVVPAGKLRWIEGTKDDHKEHSAWYFFEDLNEKDTIIQPRKSLGGPYLSFKEKRAATNAQLMQMQCIDRRRITR